MKTLCVAIGLVLIASAARSQTIEATGIIGYTTTAGIEKTAIGVQDSDMSGGFTWGAQGGYFFSDRIGVELVWTQQRTGLKLSTSSGSATLFDVRIDLVHGNFVYQFAKRGAGLQPFAFVGLGSSTFIADELQHETKLSWAAGGGVNWFPREHIGLRAQARFKPTHLDASSSSFCDPFGFCQGWLSPFDVAVGLTFRF